MKTWPLRDRAVFASHMKCRSGAKTNERSALRPQPQDPLDGRADRGSEAGGFQRGAQARLVQLQRLEMPCFTAPAWSGQTAASNGGVDVIRPTTPATSKGWRRIICSTGRAKYSAMSLPFTTTLPEPGFTQTRATASFRLPVA